MDDELRVLLCILLARLDNRTEITHDEITEAKRVLREHQIQFVTWQRGLDAPGTLQLEMRHRSRIVIPG